MQKLNPPTLRKLYSYFIKLKGSNKHIAKLFKKFIISSICNGSPVMKQRKQKLRVKFKV